MRSEELSELVRGVERARKIAVAANVLFKLRVSQRAASEGLDSGTVEVLLKLAKAGGATVISSLTAGDARQTMTILREMERSNLVKIFETPFRTYVVLTDRGWKLFNELVSVLT